MTEGQSSDNSKPSSRKAVIVKSPQSMTMFSATAKCILDELRERHRTIERTGNKRIHPTELLTLDKLNEALFKYSNLSEQAKSPASVDQALKQLTDYPNNYKERYLYLYPFLIRSANKVIAKVAMIAPQTHHEQDVYSIREACFDYSKAVIDLILSNRAKKVKEIEEENPGKSLFQKNKNGLDWLYPNRFSLESEITQMIKGGFKPYTFFPLKEFIEDFIDYGESKKSLEALATDYHLIIDEIQLKDDGSYVRQPEMVIHYRAQADGLEKFVMMYLPKFADEVAPSFKQKLAAFKTEFIDGAPAGRKQSREKMKALITLLREFPMSLLTTELGKNFRETVTSSISILEKLIVNMDKLIGRKYESISKNLNTSIIQIISEHTKSNLSLYVLDMKKEIERVGIKEKDKIDEFSSQIIKEISKNYPIKETRDIDGNKIYYIVDQSYMAGVLHKYATTPNPDAKTQREYDIAKQFNDEMVRTKNPRLNVNIRPDLLEKLSMDILKHERSEMEKEKSEFYSNKFNYLAGIIGFGIGLIITIALFTVENDAVFLVFGIPFSILVGYLCAILIKKRISKGERNEKGEFKQIDVSKDSSDEKLNQIAKAASKFIFPAKYNKIIDKVYDTKTLKAKINQHFDEIRSSVPILAKEEDGGKIASTIEHAILNSSVVISIPNELVPQGKSNSIIISKNDFKAPLYRTQLAEFYRSEAEKNRADKALVKYYTFLINTLEIDYPKYLNKKIR
jgi:hypothetical protein